MKVVALSAARWRAATRLATGVEPWCSPPGESLAAPFGSMEAADVLYFNLHGKPGEAVWYGDGGIDAVSGFDLTLLKLGGKIAFTAACYALDDDDLSAGPMVRALLNAGCAAVVAGAGPNYGGTVEAAGTDVLGKWFLHGLRWGLTASRALLIARAAIAPAAVMWRPERDAFEFRLLGDPNAVVRSREDAGARVDVALHVAEGR